MSLHDASALPGEPGAVEAGIARRARSLGRPVLLLDDAPSTQDEAFALARSGAPDGALVVARTQMSGRGRHGRAWSSPPGGLWMSLLLRPDPEELRRVPVALLAGLACCEAIEEAAPPLRCGIKWPNDVTVEGRKVAGILGEVRDVARAGAGAGAGAGAPASAALALGIGVNANVRSCDLPPELRPRATSLLEERGGAPVDLLALLAALLGRLEELRGRALAGEAGAAIEAIARRLVWVGREVTVRGGGEPFRGVVRGLGPDGALLVALGDGTISHLRAGEVTTEPEPSRG